jgi:hypothetical protein
MTENVTESEYAESNVGKTSNDSFLRQDSCRQKWQESRRKILQFYRSTSPCSMSNSRKGHTLKLSAPIASVMGRISDRLSFFALADGRPILNQVSRLLSAWIKDLLTVETRHIVLPKPLLSVLGRERANSTR